MWERSKRLKLKVHLIAFYGRAETEGDENIKALAVSAE
jgi:hypothetical protein